MPIILRPWGAADLAEATVHPETGESTTLTNIPAGSYQVGRVVWNDSLVEVQAVPEVTAPGTPMLSTDGAVTTHDSLTWIFTDGANGGSTITDRRVEVYLASDGSLVATLTATPWTVTGLDPETGYYALGFAQNAIGWSSASTPSNASTTKMITAPAAPVLSLINKTDETITVSWPEPADGGSAITAYRLYVDGVLSINPATSPQAIVGLDPETAYSITVAALNAVGLGPQSAPLAVTTNAANPDPEPDALAYGYLSDRDEGMAGDWFVAPDGDDGAAGTLAAPFATIQHALDGAAPGDVIRVRGGVYRETVSFAGKGGSAGQRTTVARYGAEQVIISGAEAVSGWAACTVDDLDVVGANWAHVHKLTLPMDSFVGDDFRAPNIFAGGQRLFLAASKVPMPQKPAQDGFQDDWLVADEVVTELIGGDAIIKGHRLPSLTDKYTKAQIERCDIRYHHSDNRGARRPVTNFDPVTKTIETANTSDWYASGTKRNRFALFNLLPAMRPGQWGWQDHGDDTVTLYVWPHAPADMALVEIAARGVGAYVTASHIELRGLIFERQASSGDSTNGLYAVSTGNSSTTRDTIVVDNVMIRDTQRSNGYGAVYLKMVDNWRCTNLQVERAIGQFGLFAHGSPYPAMHTGGVLDRFLIRETSAGPLRFYGQQNARITRGQASACGTSTHSNKASNYESCSNILYWGVDFSSCGGYWTWQEASGIHLAFCNVPGVFSNSARGVENQNQGPGKAPATERGEVELAYLINNAVAPFRDALGYSNGISLGNNSSNPSNPFDPLARFVVANNISHGISDPSSLADVMQGNYITNSGSVGSVYADVVRGDISIREDSPTWGETGADLTAIISTLQSLHPDFDGFDRDLAGQPFDAANPPVGPYAAPGTTVPLPATWIEVPAIAGAPVVGEPLTLGEGYLMGAPYPERGQQWLRSGDGGMTWEAIPGATGATYTPDEDDEGCLIGADLAHGARTAVAAPVVNDYPLGTPQLLTLARASARPIESEPIISTGKPLLVIVSTRSGVSTGEAVITATIGAEGREMMTGTPLDAGPYMNRNGAHTQVCLLLDPPVGEVTVQATSDISAPRMHVLVFEVEGLAGFGAQPAQVSGTSVITRSASVTTTQPDSGALFIVTRRDGSLENPITMTGADIILSNTNTDGEHATNDLTICVGYSRAPDARTYAASATWPMGATVMGRAIELLSGGGDG